MSGPLDILIYRSSPFLQSARWSLDPDFDAAPLLFAASRKKCERRDNLQLFDKLKKTASSALSLTPSATLATDRAPKRLIQCAARTYENRIRYADPRHGGRKHPSPRGAAGPAHRRAVGKDAADPRARHGRRRNFPTSWRRRSPGGTWAPLALVISRTLAARARSDADHSKPAPAWPRADGFERRAYSAVVGSGDALVAAPCLRNPRAFLFFHQI